jgi:malic enzyme
MVYDSEAVSLGGTILLHTPRYNRSSSYSTELRAAHGVEDMLPPRPNTYNEEVARAHAQLSVLDADLPKYRFLSDLQTWSEMLYFAVQFGGGMLVSGQGNNVYIFPALGMAVYATQARRVTQQMFIRAARSVASQVRDEELAMGLIYPPQSRILETSLAVAAEVAEEIQGAGVARAEVAGSWKEEIAKLAYRPVYPELGTP